jgi:hypothetical protein
MKNQFLTVLFILITGAYSSAQKINVLSVQSLLNEGESKYKELVDKSNKTIARFEIDQTDQLSGKLTPVKLTSGITYTILLLGEADILSEIGLKIYPFSDRSRLLKSEVDNKSRILETTFKPDNSAYFDFEIIAKMLSGENNTGRYCLIVAN